MRLPNNRSNFFILCFIYALGLLHPYSISAQDWPISYGNLEQTNSFQTIALDEVGVQLQTRTLSLPWSATLYGTLIGDVMGKGTEQWISANSAPPFEIQVVDPLSGNFQEFPIPGQFAEGTWIRCIQLIEYDNQPGFEVFCSIGYPTTSSDKNTYIVFSPHSNKILAQFQGITGQDVDGDGNWNGAEYPLMLFKAKSGAWKYMATIHGGHSDYKPRAITLYDVATGKLEHQFNIDAVPKGVSVHTLPTGEVQIFVPVHTPDNVIRVDGEPIKDENGNYINVSEIVDGIKMTDREGYVYSLLYDDTLPESQQLTLQWYKKLGELISCSSSIIEDSQGRSLAICFYYVIRAWDPVTPGRLMVFDLKTGAPLQTFQEGEEISYEYMAVDPQTGSIYTELYETPTLIKYQINHTQALAKRDFEQDSLVDYTLIGITDMDGDGSTDVLVLKTSPLGSELMVLDSDFKTKSTSPIPLPYPTISIGDIDKDGYPEIYTLDKVTRQTLSIVEYQPPSVVSDFELYDSN